MTHRRYLILFTILLSLAPTFSAVRASTATAPLAAGYFTGLPPGATLPSEADCGSRVRRSQWEPRPANSVANQTVPATPAIPGFTPDHGGTDIRARALADRVTGGFRGTTDEIIQWAACKWGFSDDSVRAQAVAESGWLQSTAADTSSTQSLCPPGYTAPCPQSFGLLQVKASAWPGTFPSSRDSTAFNIDYALMVRRVCYEGWINWLYQYPTSSVAYRAGDDWGCIGFWYSGNWYGSGVQAYVDGVRQTASTDPWSAWPDMSGAGTAAGSVALTATPETASPGTPLAVKWSAPVGSVSTRDWIGIFKVGDANTSYGEWHYTGGASGGTMPFTAPAAGGNYQFRYLVNDSYTAVGTSNSVTIGLQAVTTTTTLAPATTTTSVAPAASFILTVPTTAVRGAPITVSWTAPAGRTSALDWISVYSPGSPNASYGEWHYTGGGTTGTMPFLAPTVPAAYEFRYLLDDSYASATTSPPVAVR